MALPRSYELSAAVLLVIGGGLACFAGYRLFRIVLGIYGFLFGAMLATAAMAPTGPLARIIVALGGGVAGIIVLGAAYFIGIAIIGAAIGAMFAHAGWSYVRGVDPPALAVIALTLAGALAAMVVQRYMAVFSTAFGGGWTMIVGGLALTGQRSPASVMSAGDAWLPYPLIPPPARPWIPITWIALGLVGTAVQLGITGRSKNKKRRKRRKLTRRKTKRKAKEE